MTATELSRSRPPLRDVPSLGPAGDFRLAGRVLAAGGATLGEAVTVPILHDRRLANVGLARYVARCARYHNVLPLLWSAAEHGGATTELRDATLTLYRPAVGHALRLRRVLRQLVIALTEAGVPFAVFKGPALGRRYYRYPEHRVSSDVDILIAAQDLGDAGVALRRAGFGGPLAAPPDSAPGLGEVSYELAGCGLVDVHWHIMREARVRRAFGLRTEAMLQRVQRAAVDGLSLPMLDDADAAIAVATHACFDGAYRLGWLVDLALVLRLTDPAELRGRCQESGVALPVAVVADRMALALGVGAPDLGIGHPFWRVALSAVAHARPVQQSFQQPLRASLLYRATQASSADSGREFLRLLARESLPEATHSGHRLWQSRAHRDTSEIL